MSSSTPRSKRAAAMSANKNNSSILRSTLKRPVVDPATTPTTLGDKKLKLQKDKEWGNEQWDMEAIVAHYVSKNKLTLEYEIKWKNWTGGNSWELEARMLDLRPLHSYWTAQITNPKTEKLARGALALIALGKHNCLFVHSDNQTPKLRIMPALVDNCQPWQPRLYSLLPADQQLRSINSHLETFFDELIERIVSESEDYPAIVLPLEDDDDYIPDDALLPPIDVFTFRPLLTERVAREVQQLKNNGAGGPVPNLLTRFARYPDDPSGVSVLNTHMWADSKSQPERMLLGLTRWEGYWRLEARDHIKRGRRVLTMGGELVALSEAVRCAREQGEQVSFFHVLPLDKDYALDRRKRFDPSIYIEHSCDPNCGVYVEYPYGVDGPPLPALYAIKDIRKDDTLTVDFFEAFKGREGLGKETEGEMLFDYMMEQMGAGFDLAWCSCQSELCRGVVWMEPKVHGVSLTSPKTRRLLMAKDVDVCGVVVRDAATQPPPGAYTEEEIRAVKAARVEREEARSKRKEASRKKDEEGAAAAALSLAAATPKLPTARKTVRGAFTSVADPRSRKEMRQGRRAPSHGIASPRPGPSGQRSVSPPVSPLPAPQQQRRSPSPLIDVIGRGSLSPSAAMLNGGDEEEMNHQQKKPVEEEEEEGDEFMMF